MPVDMVVLRVIVGVAGLGVELRTGGAFHAEPARHAEVHDERLAGRERREQVLRAPCHGRHRVADEPVLEAGGEGDAQRGAADEQRLHAGAGHHRRQHAAHEVNLGQFGHGARS
jgi:hypothetical protein